MPTLTLIRGLPGSGKSTLAKKIALSYGADVSSWLEADMFFTDQFGGYKFDMTLIEEAHEWCQASTRLRLIRYNQVIVANTFTRRWELEPYFVMAKDVGAKVNVIECHGSFGNIHGVPDEVIKKMASRWEPFQPEWLLEL